MYCFDFFWVCGVGVGVFFVVVDGDECVVFVLVVV